MCMSNAPGTAGLPEITESFESIERLVRETPRGRWFLDELAKRQRSKELTLILDAIERLERSINWKDAAAAADTAASRITKPAEPAPRPENLEARHLKYFKKDEDIFAPAPPVGPRPVADAEPEKKGAKLVIRRKETDATPDPFAAVEKPVTESAPRAAVETGESPKRRIVIIRHKAGEEIDVPLQNEVSQAS